MLDLVLSEMSRGVKECFIFKYPFKFQTATLQSTLLFSHAHLHLPAMTGRLPEWTWIWKERSYINICLAMSSDTLNKVSHLCHQTVNSHVGRM